MVQEATRHTKPDAREKLAQDARLLVYEHLYRRTLNEDLADEITQECMFAFTRSLDKPRAWLLRVAHNKLCDYYGRQARRREVMAEIVKQMRTNAKENGLDNMIDQEQKETIFTVMKALKQRHRDVLVMRCYDKMAFSQIGDFLGIGKFGAKMLFWRAKNALQKKLARAGLGKTALLTSLILFGKLTAQNTASAARVSIAPATLNVGSAAAAAAILTGKAVIVSVAAAAVISFGTWQLMPPTPGSIPQNPAPPPTVNTNAWSPLVPPHRLDQQWWYFRPLGPAGPLWMKLWQWDAAGKQRRWIWLQNAEGNFYFDGRRVCRVNHRYHNPDLSPVHVPAEIDNRPPIAVGDFTLSIPAGTQEIDLRDPLHQRGWTAFHLSGHILGQTLAGGGQIPFLWKHYDKHPPRLHLTINNRPVQNASFAGLMRPWQSLHTLDTLRRDALHQGLTFSDPPKTPDSQVTIEIYTPARTLTYTIDLQKDLIDKITFTGTTPGEIIFNYNITYNSQPIIPETKTQPTDMIWLLNL